GLALGGRQQRLVLAAVAVDVGGVVVRQALIDRVWDEAPPGEVAAAVYAHVSRLRGLLARVNAAEDRVVPVRLDRLPGGYVLRAEPDEVDLHRFRRLVARARDPAGTIDPRAGLLRDALALWRGEPLAGLPGSWAARTRDAWRQQYLDAVVAWGDAAARAGGARGPAGGGGGPLAGAAGRASAGGAAGRGADAGAARHRPVHRRPGPLRDAAPADRRRAGRRPGQRPAGDPPGDPARRPRHPTPAHHHAGHRARDRDHRAGAAT